MSRTLRGEIWGLSFAVPHSVGLYVESVFVCWLSAVGIAPGTEIPSA